MAAVLTQLMSAPIIDYKRIRQLLEDGVDPLMSPLELALELSSESLVQLLLTYCDKSKLLNPDTTLLHYACRRSNMECVELLLNAGFKEYNLLNSMLPDSGDTPLICAISSSSNVVTVLLSYGADPNICNTKGCYPVHFAAKCGNMQILDDLNSYGALFTVQDSQNNTPLHGCIHVEVLECLVRSHHVDPTIKNIRGLTASMIAERTGNEMVAVILKDLEKYWYSRKQRLALHRLMWYIHDTTHEVGWKISLFIILLCIVCAWVVTVYIYGKHPF